MIESVERHEDRFEGLDEEERSTLEELEEAIQEGGAPEDRKIAFEFVEQQRLLILVSKALETLEETDANLYMETCGQMGVQESDEMPDAHSLAENKLSSPDDSEARASVIHFLELKPEATQLVRRLNELDRLLQRAA